MLFMGYGSLTKCEKSENYVLQKFPGIRLLGVVTMMRWYYYWEYTLVMLWTTMMSSASSTISLVSTKLCFVAEHGHHYRVYWALWSIFVDVCTCHAHIPIWLPQTQNQIHLLNYWLLVHKILLCFTELETLLWHWFIAMALLEMIQWAEKPWRASCI